MNRSFFELLDKQTQNVVGYVSWKLTNSKKSPRKFSKVAIFDNATLTLKADEVYSQLQTWLADKPFIAKAKEF